MISRLTSIHLTAVCSRSTVGVSIATAAPDAGARPATRRVRRRRAPVVVGQIQAAEMDPRIVIGTPRRRLALAGGARGTRPRPGAW